MGTARRPAPPAGDITLGQAADAYCLATLHGAEHTPAHAGSTDRPGKRQE